MLFDFLIEKNLPAEEIWIDQKEIEGGALWFDRINEALEQAYSVLVIVTEQSLQSTWVTYEWSFAMAQGTPVIPLDFRERKSEISSPLNSLNYEDCVSGIPDTLFELIDKHRGVSGLTIFSARKIFDQFIPLMTYIRICLWMYELGGYHPNQYGPITNLISEEISHLTKELMPDFWLYHSHALTIKQRLRYRHFETICQDIQLLVSQLGPKITQPTDAELPSLFKQLKSHLFKFYATEIPDGYDALRNWEIIAQYFRIADDLFIITLGDPFATHKNEFAHAGVSKVIETLLPPHRFQIVRNLVESLQAKYDWRN